MTKNDAVRRLRLELARLQAKVARLEALGGKDEILADPEFMAEMDKLASYDLDKLPLAQGIVQVHGTLHLIPLRHIGMSDIPPAGKKRYHIEVEIEGGKKHYEVFADDENEAVIAGQGRFLSENPGQDFLTISVQEASAGEAEAVEKAWQFHLDVVGYGEDPEEAWENLLLYSLKQPPPCERVPDQDVSLENTNEKGATG
jgi:hypothetical protein